MDEAGIIDRFFTRRGTRRRDVPIGIGDDAAVVRAGSGQEWVVALDVLNNGVHFPEGTDAASVGHKALAVNLSDVAAMGADPAWATLGLTLPEPDESWLAAFSDGFFELAEHHGVQLVGGDTTRGPLSIAVQVIGEVSRAGYLTRSGARPGDVIYVSGSLGDAALGLQVANGAVDLPRDDAAYFLHRLNRPSPRVALGRALAGEASAAIDISDGLAADLGHLCDASGTGATAHVDQVPLSGALRRTGPAMEWASILAFGDDYELCFTVRPDNTVHVEELAAALGERITPIGRMGGSELEWRNQDETFSLDEQGYRHF